MRNENRVGEETTELLRSNLINRNNNNYQSFNDLCNKSLGSLQLLVVQGPKQSILPSQKFKGNIFLPIKVYKEIQEYLDNYSIYCLRCTSKSIKIGLDLCNKSLGQQQQTFRIEPLTFMNKLRGIIVSDSSILNQQISSIPEDHEQQQERKQINNHTIETNQTNQQSIQSLIIYGILISLMIIFLYYLFQQIT